MSCPPLEPALSGAHRPVQEFAVWKFVPSTECTQDGGAYTAGVLMHAMKDYTVDYVVEHVARGQWSARDREDKIKLYAQLDAKLCPNYQIVIEQEPGSGGLESADSTIRNLAGFRAVKDKVTGSKDMRAEPFAAQVQGNNVRLVAGAQFTTGLFSTISLRSRRPSRSRKTSLALASSATGTAIRSSRAGRTAKSPTKFIECESDPKNDL
jgi:phage terminase large subunit-like protein